MALTVDAKCAAPTEISAVNGTTGKTSTSLTVTASATALFAVLVFDGSANLSSIAMHWDATSTNVAMTQIGSTVYVSTVGQIAMFGLVSPVSGAKTLKATWSGTGTGYMASMSFAGTITSSVASCFTTPITATPTGSTGTLTLTSAANGNYSVAAVGNDDQAYTTVIHATGSTNLFSDTNENYGGAAYAPETTTTIAYSWATSTSQQSVAAGCTVQAAASGTNANVTGVNGTGAAGTLVANVEPGSTGGAGTGGAGSLTASIGEGPTGVAGTSAAGTVGGQLSDTLVGVAGTGGAGTAVASIGGNISGASGTGGVGVLQGVQGTNATVSGVGGTGQAGIVADDVDAGGMSGVGGTGQPGSLTTQTGQSIGITGVEGDGAAGTLTTTSENNLIAAPIQGGPGDDDDEASADARRQKWLEWSRKKRLKEKAKLAVPQPVIAEATPEAPTAPGQSLLERNLHAQRLQIMQDMIAAQEAVRLQDEDDEEAIALLLDA